LELQEKEEKIEKTRRPLTKLSLQPVARSFKYSNSGLILICNVTAHLYEKKSEKRKI